MRRHAASHPQVVSMTVDLLWSINERLAGNEGLSVPRLGVDWLEDIVTMARNEGDAMEDLDDL